MMHRLPRTRALRIACITALACVACEDPARPVPEGQAGARLSVDSDPQGGRVSIDGDETGQVTPFLFDQLLPGVRTISIELDTTSFTYSFVGLAIVDPDSTVSLVAPLTIRCSSALCLREASEFHSAGNIRFAVNAAGPLFVYDRVDQGIVWPSSTPNSYSPLGAATITGLVDGESAALGLRNAGTSPNYWAGRPLPERLATEPYQVRVPAWIVPQFPSSTTLRGLEITQVVVIDESLPNALEIIVTWRNISADSLYRVLDPVSPEQGIVITDAYLGFLLDADIGAIEESNDDLISYSPEHDLVFAYDSDLEVTGFTAGWADEPGMVGLMLIEGPGTSVRLNAWPKSRDFIAGATDADGRVLIMAEQGDPPNHAHPSIGFAPDDEVDDYILSVATGPVTLAPGESATARFAVLLAPPAVGTSQSGTLLPAGDPLDAGRPLAATAAHLLALADSIIGLPSMSVRPPAE